MGNNRERYGAMQDTMGSGRVVQGATRRKSGLLFQKHAPHAHRRLKIKEPSKGLRTEWPGEKSGMADSHPLFRRRYNKAG
ncbi:hypothetical protein [Methanogenium sp. MK-MG]|uniref:hypothetical protein n=1 Tax=Methanogenium sp. MK-MG TaxID=2599926 RepID=UPI0013EAD639|nr:hypothetical protein [Methanogenium sp. MK-MG]